MAHPMNTSTSETLAYCIEHYLTRREAVRQLMQLHHLNAVQAKAVMRNASVDFPEKLHSVVE